MDTKRQKNKRHLLKILNKFYVDDLKKVCDTFILKKNGNKSALKQRVIELIESEKDFCKVRKEVKRVYKANDRIKKTPKIKKGKKKKPKKKANKRKQNNLQNLLANCVKDSESSASESDIVPPITSKPSVQRQNYQSVNSNNDIDFLDLNIFDNFQQNDNYSTDSSAELWAPTPQPLVNPTAADGSHQSFAQTVNNALNAVNSASIPPQSHPPTVQQAPMLVPPPSVTSHQFATYRQPPNLLDLPHPDPSHESTSGPSTGFNFNNHRNIINHFHNMLRPFPNQPFYQSRPPNCAQANPMQTPTQTQNHNMVFNPPLLRQYVPNNFAQQNNYNSLRDPLDLRNNPFPTSNSGQPNSHQFHPSYNPNYYQNQNQFQSQNPIPDDLQLNLDSLIEQQKFILSQFPNSFQENETNSCESDVGVVEKYVFKALPKFKVIKTLIATKTIGSLSDIGERSEFSINVWDLDPLTYPRNPLNNILQKEQFKTILDRKSIRILLRFGYVEHIQAREQKDSIPEHLCIECNDTQIFSYDEDEENDVVTTVPFDLSEHCSLDRNKIRFYMSKPNYTFLMPCIYEICLVELFTTDKYFDQLKHNENHYLSSEFTTQLIKARNEQLSQDENISVVNNSDIKLKLICPLSCGRIVVPIRTIDCKHIECFDAYSFLKANESRYDWLCPICQKCAAFNKLRIDGYVKEILRATENTNRTEVFIKPDATYDSKQSQTESEIIDLDESTVDSDIEIAEVSVVDSDGCIVLD